MDIRKLELKDINQNDERFRTSYFLGLEKMIQSLDKEGVINPLLVTVRDNKNTLVTGWKRFLACKQISMSPVPVSMIENEDDLKTFLIGFYENWATREFNIIEKAEILKKLKLFGEKEKEIVKTFLPLLGMNKNMMYYDLYLKIAEFSPEVKEAIVEKEISFSIAQLLVHFNSKQRKYLLPLISSAGKNKQKEILEYLEEISKRESVTVDEIFEWQEIKAVMDSPQLTFIQKANKLRDVLKKKKYPRLMARKKAFDQTLKKLNIQEDITVQPSMYFEEEGINVSFSVKNKTELLEKVDKIKEMASRKEFPELFE
ncbi:MAG: ParB/RepB/Spo0J family partition protein [Candidatus Aminicenantaceae bacterium]